MRFFPLLVRTTRLAPHLILLALGALLIFSLESEILAAELALFFTFIANAICYKSSISARARDIVRELSLAFVIGAFGASLIS